MSVSSDSGVVAATATVALSVGGAVAAADTATVAVAAAVTLVVAAAGYVGRCPSSRCSCSSCCCHIFPARGHN